MGSAGDLSFVSGGSRGPRGHGLPGHGWADSGQFDHREHLFLAYHDELTSLPARRAFNDALLRLQKPYAVAVVDIDHFKKFNDSYGHETGDQVLRMVAGKLAGITGGGRAYRVGGEEFSILFPGKTAKDALPHLELLRSVIEVSTFRVRAGQERRRASEARRQTSGQEAPDSQGFSQPGFSRPAGEALNAGPRRAGLPRPEGRPGQPGPAMRPRARKFRSPSASAWLNPGPEFARSRM